MFQQLQRCYLLFTFKAGKDGGIDICSLEIDSPKVMIQAKHYIGSKFSDLKKVMNNENKHRTRL